MALLEQVFKRQGVPTYTYVKPNKYAEILISVRTAGRSIVIEGPSGIGKSTIIEKIIEELSIKSEVKIYSARKKGDLENINDILDHEVVGVVIIDDFHRLSDLVKSKISSKMKVMADEGREDSKLIAIGINQAGQRLIDFSDDLSLRIDVFKLEANDEEKIIDLFEAGEKQLNIKIANKQNLARRAQGSFQIAQVLGYAICVKNEIDKTVEGAAPISVLTSVDVVVEKVMEDLSRQFMIPCLTFARGSKLRPEGRAPYLHILKWLADATDWSLHISEELRARPEHRGSVGQVVDKGFLADLFKDPQKESILAPHFHYDERTTILSAEDPKLIFFLKNLVWRVFTKRAGFSTDFFDRKFDFALSFAGAQRNIAKKIFDILTNDHEIAVFYDEDEQHRIIANEIEDYLVPIYKSEALFVVPILSPEYPTRIWTKIESDAFRDRFGENSIICIRLSSVADGYFSEYAKYGGLGFDLAADADSEARRICDVLVKRMADERIASAQGRA